jgi:3-deoxy-D-manno-octulosonic-acid transferase
MLNLFYNLSIRSYSFIIKILAPFNSKAKFWTEGRKDVFERLGSTSLTNRDSTSLTNRDSTSLTNRDSTSLTNRDSTSLTNRDSTSLAWFHCASLGEFEQGRPVIEAFRAKYPVYKILVTFFSPSGYEIRKNYAGADFIFYLPADTPENARKFIEIVKPSIAFFVKYEFWRNYLSELKKHQIPVVSFSAIFALINYFSSLMVAFTDKF